MKDALIGVVLVFSVIGLVASVIGLVESEAQIDRMSRVEAEFRKACTAVNGSTTWNGRNWECLK